MEILSRVPDPHLLVGLPSDKAERWAGYFYRLPKDPEKSATLKTRTFSLYDPFAHRDKFPAGIWYCVNVYVGCSHHCAYCYAKNYILRACLKSP